MELTGEERRRLLRWARQAIEEALSHGRRLAIDPTEPAGAVRLERGVFVTITAGGELRGCMGSIDFDRPLLENLVDAAISTALRDPRFPPITEEELPAVRLEVSVLERPVELPDPARFDPTVHGIIVEKGWRRALLLPKVAQERGWDTATTLAAACLKAGLPPDAWRDPDARLRIFEVEAFEEPDEAGRRPMGCRASRPMTPDVPPPVRREQGRTASLRGRAGIRRVGTGRGYPRKAGP